MSVRTAWLVRSILVASLLIASGCSGPRFLGFAKKSGQNLTDQQSEPEAPDPGIPPAAENSSVSTASMTMAVERPDSDETSISTRKPVRRAMRNIAADEPAAPESSWKRAWRGATGWLPFGRKKSHGELADEIDAPQSIAIGSPKPESLNDAMSPDTITAEEVRRVSDAIMSSTAHGGRKVSRRLASEPSDMAQLNPTVAMAAPSEPVAIPLRSSTRVSDSVDQLAGDAPSLLRQSRRPPPDPAPKPPMTTEANDPVASMATSTRESQSDSRALATAAPVWQSAAPVQAPIISARRPERATVFEPAKNSDLKFQAPNLANRSTFPVQESANRAPAPTAVEKHDSTRPDRIALERTMAANYPSESRQVKRVDPAGKSLDVNGPGTRTPAEKPAEQKAAGVMAAEKQTPEKRAPDQALAGIDSETVPETVWVSKTTRTDDSRSGHWAPESTSRTFKNPPQTAFVVPPREVVPSRVAPPVVAHTFARPQIDSERGLSPTASESEPLAPICSSSDVRRTPPVDSRPATTIPSSTTASSTTASSTMASSTMASSTMASTPAQNTWLATYHELVRRATAAESNTGSEPPAGARGRVSSETTPEH